MKKRKGKSLDSYLKSELKDKELKKHYDEAGLHLKIAHLIETLRFGQGLTQTELANRAGVSQPMIARLERGDQDRVPTLATINKVLLALGHVAELVIKKAS